MSDHPDNGPGVSYGRPSCYDGPSVPQQAALINPSAGDVGEPGGGVNPVGPDVYSPGMTPESVSSNHGDTPFPDTTVGTR